MNSSLRGGGMLFWAVISQSLTAVLPCLQCTATSDS